MPAKLRVVLRGNRLIPELAGSLSSEVVPIVEYETTDWSLREDLEPTAGHVPVMAFRRVAAHRFKAISLRPDDVIAALFFPQEYAVLARKREDGIQVCYRPSISVRVENHIIRPELR